VKPLIARRGTQDGSGLGAQRRVVERAFAHLHQRDPIERDLGSDKASTVVQVRPIGPT